MRLLLVVDNVNTGLFYHRIYTPYYRLAEVAGWDIQVEMERKIQHIPDSELITYNYVVFLRNVDIQGSGVNILERIKRLGVKTIIDIDDYPDLHQTHGLAKAYKYYNVFEQVKKELAACDLVTTTTEHFAKWLRLHNKNVQVYPNCINTKDAQWQKHEVKSDLVRFGWAGGVYHEKDIQILQKSLIEFYRTKKGFQIVLGGYNVNPYYEGYETVMSGNGIGLSPEYREWLKEKTQLQEHIYWHEPYRRVWGTSTYEYGAFYNQIDVALIPLQDNTFNSYKSEIKLIEAGVMGKAAIVSNVLPYNIVPKDVALFVDKTDIKGFYKAMKLMMDKDVRYEYAFKLSEYVKKNYDLDSWTVKRHKWLASE